MSCYEIFRVLGRPEETGYILAKLILSEKVTSGEQSTKTTHEIVRSFGIHRAWAQVERLRISGGPGAAEVMSGIIMLAEAVINEFNSPE